MPAEEKGRHIHPPEELEFPQTLHDDRHRLEEVDVPIVTISATFRGEIAEYLGEKSRVPIEEAVFSRAHFSMAIAVFEQATRLGLSAWLVDPTNYVSQEAWKKILFTEWLGEKVARSRLLKRLKDFVDTFARSKLPIEEAVREPLQYVSYEVKKPIISMHYESGNLLSAQGKKTLQVVTDPHVRINYLFEAGRSNISFAVFDEETRKTFLERAEKMGKSVNPDRVIVTGPPVDPRIVEAREGKSSSNFKKRPLRLAITTGGLGQNKKEIKKILEGITTWAKEEKIRLFLYAGTHPDFKELYQTIADKYGIKPGKKEDGEAPLRIFYHPSIVEANKALIDYAFPWADGFITKPSGDMAYDAAAAGCFILSLHPWGEWEKNIEGIFARRGILEPAQPDSFPSQLENLLSSGFIESAIKKALAIEPLYLEGARKIVDLQQSLL